ncbi:MAG: ATP-binding protein, partial [Bacillus sp. (in: firmicutes)]
DENSIIEGFNSGGQDYITKPYNAPELVARVKSQLKISRQSRKLTQAYRELEYFSYTASHELKSPILIINQLIHILKEQLLTDKEKAELFKNLDEKCKQSTMIIDGLLNLSKAFQHKIAMDQIDAEKICGELVKEFISLNPNRKYSIYIDHQHCPLLSDKILFTILIQNLLSNSFKFTKNKILTQISIHFAIKDNLFSVQIKDNGIGFDNEYKEKVFEVFTRLHPFEEYNGNGIGLATVKKIMHRMQGEVQIHSTPGQGTTVTLLLPQ